ncbi:hypothetical protein BLA6992_00001 [Burkholderia lata]|nr:hypothetical protein BLA6992_00001 [Burkholderia lata]
MGKPCAGISGIDRQVSAAGLEHGQQCDDHRDAALGAHGDGRIGTDAELDEVMREPVGAGIEGGIGELLMLRDERDGLGRLPGLRLDELVNALVRRVGGLRRIPRLQQ